MIAEYLEKICILPRKGCSVCVLFSLDNNIDEIKEMQAKGKKIAIFSLRKLAESLLALNSVGIKPDVLCNSNIEICDTYLYGYKVFSAWEIINNHEEYYIIIPQTSDVIRASILRQLTLHGVTTNISIVEHWDYALDFEKINDGEILKNSFYNALNQVLKHDLSNNNLFDKIDYLKNMFFLLTQGPVWWSLIYEWFYIEFKGKTDLSMLDIGPGKGIFSLSVKNIADLKIDWINLFSYEVLPNGINRAYSLNIETDDIPNNNKYDIIIMTEVIEHFSYNPVPTLIKIKRHLKANGAFFLSCPHFRDIHQYQTWKDMPHPGTELPFEYHNHIYEFKYDELKEVCQAAGFNIVREGIAVGGNTNLMLRSIT